MPISEAVSILMSLTRRLLCSAAPEDTSREREVLGECAREMGVGEPGSMKRDKACWPGEVMSRVVDGGVVGSPSSTMMLGKPG